MKVAPSDVWEGKTPRGVALCKQRWKILPPEVMIAVGGFIRVAE